MDNTILVGFVGAAVTALGVVGTYFGTRVKANADAAAATAGAIPALQEVYTKGVKDLYDMTHSAIARLTAQNGELHRAVEGLTSQNLELGSEVRALRATISELEEHVDALTTALAKAGVDPPRRPSRTRS